jgi:hypothetical protein
MSGFFSNTHTRRNFFAEAEPRLDFGHLHKGFLSCLVVDDHAGAAAAAGHQDLHAEIVEDGVAGGLLDRALRQGLFPEKLRESLVAILRIWSRCWSDVPSFFNSDASAGAVRMRPASNRNAAARGVLRLTMFVLPN